MTDSWNDAFAKATFVVYEPVGPGIHNVVAGGYGLDHGIASRLSVEADLGGTHVAVDTETIGPVHPQSSQPLQVAELVWHHLLSSSGDIELPMALVIEHDDRMVRVDGIETLFEGARVSGSDRWTGSTTVGTVNVTVTTDGPDRLGAIATCHRATLPDGV